MPVRDRAQWSSQLPTFDEFISDLGPAASTHGPKSGLTWSHLHDWSPEATWLHCNYLILGQWSLGHSFAGKSKIARGLLRPLYSCDSMTSFIQMLTPWAWASTIILSGRAFWFGKRNNPFNSLCVQTVSSKAFLHANNPEPNESCGSQIWG